MKTQKVKSLKLVKASIANLDVEKQLEFLDLVSGQPL